MGCIWRGSNRTDTTGIRNVLWEWSQALISPGCPWGGNRETFLALHPAFPHLPYLSFKGCGLGRGPVWAEQVLGAGGGAGILQGSCTFSCSAAGSGSLFPIPHQAQTHICAPHSRAERNLTRSTQNPPLPIVVHLVLGPATTYIKN